MGLLKRKKVSRKARRRLEHGRPPPGKCHRCGRHASGEDCAHCWEGAEPERSDESLVADAE